MTKDHYLFGHISNIYFFTEFQNCGSEHDHGFLWIKDAPMYGMHTNEEIERLVNMCIFCDVSLLPNPLQNAQNINTCVHVKQKQCCLYNSPSITSHA
jgi:hypothetical protein